ncbi:hypothetical protein [Streptomyces olivochromogenes]|uniref:Cytochrome P450 n=1 Tax=Streptomyces olivochromogenes TaxID=1963 RepID=A0A250V4H9_STROL|nr:hypothetical protein [Streptomyces olivochromogenes]KUN49497.1 hypothetical protein AQJ27_03095 [Streptomyces olivochromogenes]GAX49091.1 cytochrome P450 [Streptomyces olivochromogenes]
MPYEDHEFFQEHAGVTNARFKTPQAAAATTRELRRYVSGLIEAKMDDPAEDVLSDLGARVKEAISAWRRPLPWSTSCSSPATTPAPT